MILPDDSPSIEELINLCQTDWVYGTPPEKMETAFNALNVCYNIRAGFRSLKDSIEMKNPCIVRTITDEIPHWIVVYRYYKKDDFWFVNDPTSGKIEYTTDELDRIWKPRDYFCFEIENYKWNEIDKSDINIEPFDVEKFELVLELAAKIFRKHMPVKELKQFLISQTDLKLSQLAYFKNEIIGFYLIGDNQVPDNLSDDQLLIPKNEYDRILEMNGIEGIALAVLPDFRGIGVAKLLIGESYNVARRLGKNYIWGQQYKTLNNLDEWKNRRIHFATDDEVYFTIKIFEK
jgi:GNAT superfamily N-acetyltransferase